MIEIVARLQAVLMDRLTETPRREQITVSREDALLMLGALWALTERMATIDRITKPIETDPL